MRLIQYHGGLGRTDQLILAGLCRYAQGMADWELAVEGWNELAANGADEASAHVVRGNHRALDALVGGGRPVVVVGHSCPHPVTRIWVDDHAVGVQAAEWFLDRGYRHFAYRGDPALPSSIARQHGFAERLAQAGHAAIALPPGPALSEGWSYAAELADTAAALRDLPRPLALLAFTCHVGRRVLAACRRAGIGVPHEVAVLAGDDDPLVSSVSLPTLACVQAPGERLGYAVGEQLARLLNGGAPLAAPIRLPPAGIDTAGSVAGVALDDPTLAQAMRVIGERACQGLDVPALAAAVGVPRRRLELCFRSGLDRSPAQEIRRARLAEARRLLAATQLPVAAVATACGFASVTRFSADVRADTGLAPLAFRRRAFSGQ